MNIDRRMLLSSAALLASPALRADPVGDCADTRNDLPLAPPPHVTKTIAQYVGSSRYEHLPLNVRHEGVRTFVNWMGVAVGGSRNETVVKAIAALAPFAGRPEASILGRRERFDVLNAALINGISSHVLDYDDTHLKTIIHPAGPVAPAILALAQHRPIGGKDFLHALILGIEVECRIGNAIYPSHYDLGWHITGSCGVFGSAVAAGKLLKLTEQQMIWAIGIAASQPVGLKVQFGSMTKSFHPGRAAQNGLTAALLAEQNFTSNDAALEGKDGFVQATSRKVRWEEITKGLGTHYEAALNTYKPFACGIVTHPGIDAAIQLRKKYNLRPEQIAAVELHANPLVLSLTGKTEPRTGLEGKFSIYHCIAVALIYGAAGPRQFQDAVVRDPTVIALRKRVSVRTDPAVKPQQSDLTIRLKDGRQLVLHIQNAIGSLEKPLSDAALEDKFTDLADGVLPSNRARALVQMCWDLQRQPDAGAVAVAAQA